MKSSKDKALPKTGRPAAIIDWPVVDDYLRAGCTGTGIAGVLGICEDTLYRACVRDHKMTFSAYSQQKRSEGDDMLRKKQFDVAMKGDCTMIIWLGKQRLEQRDKQEVKQDSTITTVMFGNEDKGL